MADTLFIVPFQIWVYGMVYTTAIRVWLGNRALLLAGLMIEVVADWLVTEFFGPAIGDFAFLSEGLMPTFFLIAVLLLAASYLIAPFFQLRVVDWQKALGWFLFALLFYQAGPGLYVAGEAVRRALSAEFYGQVLAQANSTSTATGPVSVLNAIASGPDDAMGALANQFGAFVPSDYYVDGLDLAMAYTLSTGSDVVTAGDPLPAGFADEYFDPAHGPLFFLTMTPDERTASINAGLTGISRLLLAFVIILFGLIEQTIYLSLTVAAGILFLSMAIAILFAFFERTEMMARTLVDMWLELFILSVVIAVMQAFVVGLVTVGARTLNPTLTLGAATLGALVMGVLLLKAVGAIWDALNRMFPAMSHSVGGGLLTPAGVGKAAVGAAAGTALTLATAGAGAAVAAAAGGSLAQVAGSALGGSDALYNAAAMGSLVLPDASPLSGAAAGFYEGALSQRMLGPVGGLMFRQGQEAPRPGAALSPAASSGSQGDSGAAASGETDVRIDAADIAALRDAVASAMAQAIASAPSGGYADRQAAMAAVRQALGGAGQDPQMGDYLDRRASAISSHVMYASRQPPPGQSTTARAQVDVNAAGDEMARGGTSHRPSPTTPDPSATKPGYKPPTRL